MAQSRRLKAIRLYKDTIAEILSGRCVPIPFPVDIEVVRYFTQWETDSAVLVVASQEYPEVIDGALLDIQDVNLKRI